MRDNLFKIAATTALALTLFGCSGPKQSVLGAMDGQYYNGNVAIVKKCEKSGKKFLGFGASYPTVADVAMAKDCNITKIATVEHYYKSLIVLEMHKTIVSGE